MTLWTIQPEALYQEILNTGVYRCDFQQSHMREWQMQYDWLVAQMERRIGKRPNSQRGVCRGAAPCGVHPDGNRPAVQAGAGQYRDMGLSVYRVLEGKQPFLTIVPQMLRLND